MVVRLCRRSRCPLLTGVVADRHPTSRPPQRSHINTALARKVGPSRFCAMHSAAALSVTIFRTVGLASDNPVPLAISHPIFLPLCSYFGYHKRAYCTIFPISSSPGSVSKQNPCHPIHTLSEAVAQLEMPMGSFSGCIRYSGRRFTTGYRVPICERT